MKTPMEELLDDITNTIEICTNEERKWTYEVISQLIKQKYLQKENEDEHNARQ